MPYLETPEELADAIADLCGVYGGCTYPDVDTTGNQDCRNCKCRGGFVADMTERIRAAVRNERQLNAKVAEEVE